MESEWDVIVVGLGVMGAATARELARHGLDVLGIEQFAPLHTMGSSHGSTRIIREAYFENPLYVPLVHRAWHLWHELENESGSELLLRTGGLNIASPDSPFLAGVLRSVREHGLDHECLDRDAIITRYPALSPAPDAIGIFEPRASVLFAENCVAALHQDARKRGATLRFDEEMLAWEPVADGIRVRTASGTARAEHLVLAMGAWLPGSTPFPLAIERQAVFWFEPARNAERFRPGALPITLWEHGPDQLAYAFPNLGAGLKASLHHQGEPCTLDSVDRTVRPDDEADLRSALDPILPDAAGAIRKTTVCLYTNTRDFDFLIDAHPANPRVTVLSACSGHGFKFAPALGEAVAAMVQQKEPAFDLAPFRAERLVR